MTPDGIFEHMVTEGDSVLDRLRDCAVRHPHKTFIHYGDGDVKITFAEMEQQTARLAAGLAQAGVRPGDRVCVFTRNALVSTLSMFAIWRAGAVYAPINFYYTGRLLAYQVNDTGPAAIVTDMASLPLFVDVADQIGPQTFILHRPVKGAHDYEADSDTPKELAGHAFLDFGDLLTTDAAPPAIVRSQADIANIIYTSGTTGPAKGVVQPFRWMNQYTFLVRQFMGEDDVIYCDLPLYHVGGAFFDLVRALWRGNTVSLWNRFSPTKFWDRVCSHGATSCILVDVMIPWLMNAEPSATDRANPLRHVHMQPFPASHHDVAKRFGIDFVTVGYGQTEVGLGFIGLIDELPDGEGTPPELYRGLSRSETRQAAERMGIATVRGDAKLEKGFMGEPSPLFDVAILDPEDNRCGLGTIGQLAFRPRFPALILSEYFNKPEANRKAFANCWFHTGDAALRTTSDQILFVDRMGGFFRVRGENVSSYQVEDLVASHSAVRACAAVPIPAREGGEEDIAVFVELREGAAIAVHELGIQLAGTMPKFMQPRYLRIVDALPLTPTNKIEKYKLKASLLREVEAGATS